MVSDPRAQQAREHHRQSQDAGGLATQHREQRDQLVRQLRAEDEERWTYPALAAAVGCSPELVAAIVNPPQRRRRNAPPSGPRTDPSQEGSAR